jgi:hypothetical protein
MQSLSLRRAVSALVVCSRPSEFRRRLLPDHRASSAAAKNFTFGQLPPSPRKALRSGHPIQSDANCLQPFPKAQHLPRFAPYVQASGLFLLTWRGIFFGNAPNCMERRVSPNLTPCRNRRQGYRASENYRQARALSVAHDAAPKLNPQLRNYFPRPERTGIRSQSPALQRSSGPAALRPRPPAALPSDLLQDAYLDVGKELVLLVGPEVRQAV